MCTEEAVLWSSSSGVSVSEVWAWLVVLRSPVDRVPAALACPGLVSPGRSVSRVVLSVNDGGFVPAHLSLPTPSAPAATDLTHRLRRVPPRQAASIDPHCLNRRLAIPALPSPPRRSTSSPLPSPAQDGLG